METLEPIKIASHELGIIIEAVAEDQTTQILLQFARSTMLHYG